MNQVRKRLSVVYKSISYKAVALNVTCPYCDPVRAYGALDFSICIGPYFTIVDNDGFRGAWKP